MRGEVKRLVVLAMLVVVVVEMTRVVDGGATRKLLITNVDNKDKTDNNDVHHVDNFFGGLGGSGSGSGIFPGAGAGTGGLGGGSGIFPNPGAGAGTGGGIGVPGIGPVDFCSFPGLGCVHFEPTNPSGGLGGLSPPLPFP